MNKDRELELGRLAGQNRALMSLMAQLLAHVARDWDEDDAEQFVENACAIMPPRELCEGSPKKEAFAQGFLEIAQQVEGFALNRVRT
ncbi:hypothetical protein [Thalassovita sp.]|uniref:hypothetical protein n=1 Tax=Thalassovita sp. TaxID=1979401 RepID=UPI003B5C9865